jgi:glycosyltransferase involved in cell wall biosynthesis
MLRFFPLYGLGWAAALDEVAEPADIWHGMWAGSLPALDRMRSRFGGLTIYDSRDVYMQSRALADATGPGKSFLEWLERRWAQRADAVVTVNDAYADLLVGQLGVPRPVVLMNLPERWSPPVPRPDLIRAAVGIEPGTAVVIYQGGLMTGRGIEEAMDAILDVPDAVLVLLGFGQLRSTLVSAVSKPPYAGKVFVLDPVPPADLVSWTASADVSVMAIQPTSLNHRFTTPQKLFESIAAGIPVVASDLPGMAAIVESTGSGLVCDPTSPSAIAAAIRTLLAEPTERREQRRAHILQVAHERYNWEAEEPELLSLYRRLLEGAGLPVPDVAGRAA